MGYDAACGERIQSLLEKKVGGHIQFKIDIVEDMPLLKNGKFKIIEQKIK